MEEAWAQESGMRPPMPMGARPPLGATMQEQMRRHVDGRMGELGGEAGFFDGPMQLPGGGGGQMGADWAREFAGSGPAGPSSGLMMPPHAGMRPPGAEWADQFARQPMQPMHPAGMDAAFREAQMAHRSASSSAGPQQAAGGPMGMGPMSMGPMAMPMPMMPMMGQMGPMMDRPAFGAQADWQPPAVVQEARAEPAAPEAQVEEPKVVEDRAAQDQADLGQAAQMVEMLRNSGNPKFANSKFVSFIDKVSKGELQFEENTVVDRDGVQVDWEALYDTEAATATDAERQELERLFAAGSGSGLGGLQEAWKGDPEMEDAWKMAKEAAMNAGMSEGSMDELWRQMQQEAGGMDGEEAFHMMDPMQRGLFQEDAFNSAKKMSAYEFSKDNQYMEAEDPLALAQRLIREGRDREAVLALEAEVQRNPENSEGWRQLGQLYADMDQDVEAIQCLRKGHEVDPYNLDSLLALGVSCTNELDRLEALRYLREWMENHEEFQALTQDLQPPGNFEYEAWREQVTGLLNRAAQANPLDADVFVALGVMENINFNYDAAIAALATACRLRPNDHTCWNKLGATLANSGRDGASKAVVAYHQGLQLKPNYARSWSNLAIAHAQLGEHNDAARFYLSSLVLNPQATHIWNFLHSAVLNMNNTLPLEEANAAEGDKKAALEAVDRRDLEACTRVIQGVLDPQALPARMQELPQPPQEILASMGL